jgi:hypothetical protein
MLNLEQRESAGNQPGISLQVPLFRARNPSDIQHLNSIEKDSQGNYMISSRHYSTVYYISPAGDILWQLGGRNSSFQMGEGTDFYWQHDARWIDEGTRLRHRFSCRQLQRQADI